MHSYRLFVRIRARENRQKNSSSQRCAIRLVNNIVKCYVLILIFAFSCLNSGPKQPHIENSGCVLTRCMQTTNINDIIFASDIRCSPFTVDIRFEPLFHFIHSLLFPHFSNVTYKNQWKPIVQSNYKTLAHTVERIKCVKQKTIYNFFISLLTFAGAAFNFKLHHIQRVQQMVLCCAMKQQLIKLRAKEENIYKIIHRYREIDDGKSHEHNGKGKVSSHRMPVH